MASKIKSRSERLGILWTGVEKVAVYGINFVQGVILARLLCPEDFGLTAMLNVFFGVGTLLAESGLGVALVVKGVGLRAEVLSCIERRAFLWNIGFASALYAVLIASSWWIAEFYHEPILRQLIWVLGLSMVLSAACATANARLQRNRQFGKLSGVNVLTTLVGMLVAITMAGSGCGVWSIVGFGLAATVFRISALGVVGRRSVVPCECVGVKEIKFSEVLSFGGKIALSGLAHTIYLNAYHLVIGRMFSPSMVGLFSRGRRWSGLADEIVSESVGRIALPGLSQDQTGGAFRYAVLNAALLWPGLVILWIWAPQIVDFVLGEHWLDCVPYLRVLIVGTFFSPVTNISLVYIRAMGHPEFVLMTDAVKKPLQLGLLAFGGWWVLARGSADGVALLCWTKVAGDFVEAVVDVCFARKLAKRKR